MWPSLTTDYEVVVTDLNNCIDTAEINVQVNNLPAVNVGLDQNICKGDTALISVTGAVNYQWSPNINISSTIANSVEVWPSDSLNYIVTGVDANFCFNTDTISINILDLPIADAGLDLWICPGGSVNLNANGGLQYILSLIHISEPTRLV